MRRPVLLYAIGLTAASPLPAEQKPVVRSQSDLAQSHVLLDGLPSKAMWDKTFVTEVIPKLRAESERIRSEYDVLDPAVALQLRAGLAAIAILQGRARDATALVAEARAAATKPQDRSLALLPIDVAAASRPTDRTDCKAGAAHIADLLRSSDAAVTRDTVLGRLSQFETTSAAFLVGLARSRIDQAAGDGQRITVLQGLDLANWRVQATILPPCRTAYSAAMRAWLAEPRNRPTDIWTHREPEPKLLAGAKPVVVAVWDGGLDPSLFPGQLAIDPAEPMDGRDNDGNGVADDWNGPTYGNHMEPAPAPLAPISNELAKQLAFQMVLRKGEMDLSTGDDTPEAAIYGQRAREADEVAQERDALLWDEVGYFSHGTAVASEIADGAPFVRLYNVSVLPFRRDPGPIPLDEKQIDRWIAAIGHLGGRLRGAGVRVVNISWAVTADEIASSLRDTEAAGESQASARANVMFEHVEAALRRLIRDCPDILFVAGAGNSNQSDDLLAAVPQSLHEPNMLVVGAAGINGRLANFTTFGKGVDIYAWGVGVPVRLPGGMKAKGTGTSEAAPLVARAAASMLAVRPSLSPTALAKGLLATASRGDDGVKLLDTAAAVRWATSH